MISDDDDFKLHYCSLCDQYFYSKHLLRQHVKHSNTHPRCETCDRPFLNGHALRKHYAISEKHQFCLDCEKHFNTASGFRWHINHVKCHPKRLSLTNQNLDDVQNDFDADWEDKQGQLEDERLAQEEAGVVSPSNIDVVPTLKVEVATVVLRKRYAQQTEIPVLNQRCPICLSTPKTAVATHCGHLFCAPCISKVLDVNGSCPTCRKPGYKVQLRRVDLRAF
ncbi:hypothetical protein BD626DRAFT_464561 [Schizophyllum amplum]|uniref:RING-type domain-containing protein n=1 Tax=Schizophyllum amplum TaxID=97359 RepID=A0A550BYJ1_9AGAR|nr:hypothetical protein BD626DRAFT_464561 [Auriculariopsis ampla]